MLELPSALELEALSDSELETRIAEALKAAKEADTIHRDNSYEQRLCKALETELSRRQVTAETKAIKRDAGLLDDMFSD
ncbi:MAG: hypothetical protein ABI970_01670 [Chloroflexota bacterium]